MLGLSTVTVGTVYVTTSDSVGLATGDYNRNMPTDIVVRLAQTGPSTSEASIRQHKVVIDRPAAKGGADLGPMGGELFLASVGGCFMSNLLAAIRARELVIGGIGVKVVGTLVETPVRYESIAIEVTMDCDDDDLRTRLVQIADHGCIMTNTLRGRLDVRVTLT